MLTSVPNATVDPGSAGPARVWFDARPTSRRLDAIEVRLRRLVDSSEPAVVFSSLVRLCVPAFSDACSVDIVEGGRVRYRVSYHPPKVGTAAPGPGAPGAVVTEFESQLPGWTSFTGVMTSLWHTRSSTGEDEERAAAIVDHAIRMIRSERLADPMRSSVARAAHQGGRAPLRSC